MTSPTILCCLTDDKPKFDSIDSTKIWHASLQKLDSVRYDAGHFSPKVSTVDQDLYHILLSVDCFRFVE